MEKILIYNTPNSEEITREINDNNLKRVYKKYISNNNKNLYWGIALAFFAVFFLLFSDYPIGTFLAGGALVLFSFYSSYHINYKKIKKAFCENINKEVENLNQNSKDVFWEYAPTYFRFKNYKQDLKFSWEDITYQIIEDKYLYVIAMSNLCFILDKENIEVENFQKTMEYLKEKAVLKTD